jgi:hypothetical protein
MNPCPKPSSSSSADSSSSDIAGKACLRTTGAGAVKWRLDSLLASFNSASKMARSSSTFSSSSVSRNDDAAVAAAAAAVAVAVAVAVVVVVVVVVIVVVVVDDDDADDDVAAAADVDADADADAVADAVADADAAADAVCGDVIDSMRGTGAVGRAGCCSVFSVIEWRFLVSGCSFLALAGAARFVCCAGGPRTNKD